MKRVIPVTARAFDELKATLAEHGIGAVQQDGSLHLPETGLVRDEEKREASANGYPPGYRPISPPKG